MKIQSLSIIAMLVLPLQSYAQSGWKDMNGNAIAETEAAKSKEGFSATLVVTPDLDWLEKWNTPPETIPHFTDAKEVSSRGELAILTFLSNPKVDALGMTDVACDFIVYRPDGSKSINELGIPCFKVNLKTNPQNVYLSAASLKYVAEPSDQRGTWSVSVIVKDLHRNIEIPLRTSFLVK